MSLELKEKILDLLERDREFRYAVAGLIGLDEILKRLDQHDRKFNEILAVLKEHTARLNEHDRKFNEIVARLDEHDKKFNEILSRLDEHDRKFNSIIAEIRDIRKELVDVKSYIERLSLTLEEEAWEVITSRLRRMGVDVKLTRLILPELEINIYGAVDDLCVLGEASTKVGVGVLRSVDEKLTELRRRYPEYLRRKVLKVVYTMWATEDAVKEAKKRNIWLLKALEDLTPPNI
jgi:chromosome segregation ATPase